MEERALDRWMSLELHTLHQGLVTQPRRLAEVADGAVTQAPTRTLPHLFDLDAARRLKAALPPLLARRLKVPLTFYVDKDVEGSAYLADEAAAEAVKLVGRAPADREMREGKFWMSLPLARELQADYPTLVQFVVF